MASNDVWDVFEYEWNMARLLAHYVAEPVHSGLEWTLQNVVVKGFVLHTRILTEILLSSGPRRDDIRLCDLLPNLNSRHVDSLRTAYGDSKTPHSPKWQFDKLMAHATTHRSDSHDYLVALQAVWPQIEKVMKDVLVTNPPFKRQ